ncbi:MAG TPA: TetR/AcrR family transcriptional regulator [Acetobacteraceae bacterium]
MPAPRRRDADSMPTPRKPDADRTRRDILDVARREFAEHGLSGARVDAIAERMRTTKRMIYYYFGSKEGLYLAVLEQAYADMRAADSQLDLSTLNPVEAVRRMIERTFDYQESHPDFIRLVSIENIHHGKHLAKSKALRELNTTVIETLRDVLTRGQKSGDFRTDIDPVDLHMMISALCFFRVSNRHTFGTLFHYDVSSPALRGKHRRMIADAILRLLEPDRDAQAPAVTDMAPIDRLHSAARQAG